MLDYEHRYADMRFDGVFQDLSICLEVLKGSNRLLSSVREPPPRNRESSSITGLFKDRVSKREIVLPPR